MNPKKLPLNIPGHGKKNSGDIRGTIVLSTYTRVKKADVTQTHRQERVDLRPRSEPLSPQMGYRARRFLNLDLQI